jgi:putative colanic acid biosynthesis acetyltransferase WcaF
MDNLDIIAEKKGFVGPSFNFSNRMRRCIWQLVWLIGARLTPPAFHRWRILLLRLFSAKVSWKAYIYPNVEIWAPWNLTIADYGTLARGVVCYNIAPVTIGTRTVISQCATLCTGSHDYLDPVFPLIASPIVIGERAWVCANAFVGPGVVIGDGGILAAAGVAFRNLDAWTIYAGNPATVLGSRPQIPS